MAADAMMLKARAEYSKRGDTFTPGINSVSPAPVGLSALHDSPADDPSGMAHPGVSRFVPRTLPVVAFANGKREPPTRAITYRGHRWSLSRFSWRSPRAPTSSAGFSFCDPERRGLSLVPYHSKEASAVAYQVHLWLKDRTVVSTKTLEGPTPLFGSQIQVAVGEENVTARVRRIATNQPHGTQSIDIVSASEEQS